MSWGKKGITPLMATLLLISFAVALGVVIMNFGRAQVESESECSISIGLKISNVGGEDQFCLDRSGNRLFLIVENGINIKVDGLTVSIIGTEKAITRDLSDAKIDKAGTYLKYIDYNVNDLGELRQVKIIPKVKMYDEVLICQEKAIVLEDIRDCNN
ncbi:hypothetical protein GOV03_04575 [Candidatus Woesearchaeota archaeon]|nr:hypothetical protein [Candidatus Woesearchaeota archaeon]